MNNLTVKGPIASLILLLLMTHPLIRIADRVELVLGVPVLYLYFFGFWLLLILLMVRGRRRSQHGVHG